jgi:hypothetical protein
MNKLVAKMGLGLLLSVLVMSRTAVLAQDRVESDNYRITWPNLNMGAGVPSSSSYNLGVTTGQTAPGLYESTGYKVRAGFQYIHSIIPFSFEISDLSIAFGTLNPGSPSTETNTLTVSVGGAGGYQVTAQENNPLTSTATTTIPDTTCDPGDSCDESDAGTWTANTTYGFGFNMSGDDIPSEFSGNKYKQFADISGAETAQVVMSSANVGKDRESTVTYKINVSGTQAAGTYYNIITFIATPEF